MKKVFIGALTIFFALLLASCQSPEEPKKTEAKKIEHKFDRFPVLEYHHIKQPEARWSRTPDNFRKDLQWLYDNDYYPMNLKDILTNLEGLPEGKTPVVLTFDDSPSNQFRYLEDGTLDPECAVGIIKAFHDEHPDEWPMRATFFVLIQTNDRSKNVFGHPEDLKQLVDWGMEVGGHCYSHERLSDISSLEARYTLARASKAIEDLTGQRPVSLATPMGLYPEDKSVFSNKYQSIEYDYKLVCEVAGGFQVVPWSDKFDPLHINRIQTIDSEWRKFFYNN